MQGRSERISLQMKMLVGFLAGLVAGLTVHFTSPGAPWVKAVISYVTGPIGQIFPQPDSLPA